MTEVENKPPGTNPERMKLYRELLQLLKLETAKHQTMLKLVRSMAHEEAKRNGKLDIANYYNEGFFSFVPWEIDIERLGQKQRRHIQQNDWARLESYLKSMEELLNRIFYAEPK